MTGTFGRDVVMGGSAPEPHIAVLQVLLWTGACQPRAATAIGFVLTCALH